MDAHLLINIFFQHNATEAKIATDFVEQIFACLFIFMKLWVASVHCKTIVKEI